MNFFARILMLIGACVIGCVVLAGVGMLTVAIGTLIELYFEKRNEDKKELLRDGSKGLDGGNHRAAKTGSVKGNKPTTNRK